MGLGIRLLVVALWFVGPAYAQAPVSYRVSFPEARHHRLQVEVTFAEVPAGALEVVMSRTSPGRYAMHEFARHVYDVRVDDGAGAMLTVERPNPFQWNVSGHSGSVRVRYKVFGDRLDGTYLSVDSTHAHMNMPASLMWARGLERRPVSVTFDAPAHWKIATQLHATADPRTFTARNLQYLIDSPTELSAFTWRTFTLEREFRIALHHDGSDGDADRFASAVERIVKEARAVFGEFPAYEAPYTFIADYLPWAANDGMEHRNSAILTSPARLRVPDEHLDALATTAHEFFHSWNVERIRPRSLEPFALDAPNPSGELWFGEGFTQYYHHVLMRRAGFWNVETFAARMGGIVDRVTRSAARKYRSAEDMSRFAQYTDEAAWVDPTNVVNQFVSYYDWGAVIGMSLDLSLRARSGGTITLDHYMQALWRQFGRVAPPAEGVVARPFTPGDLRTVLAEVSGDRAFADEFFDRYIHGREVADNGALLARAGLILGKRSPRRPWMGPLTLEFSGGTAQVVEPTIEDTPVHAAGIDRGDELLSFDGVAITNRQAVEDALQRRRPGDRIQAAIRRRGMPESVTIVVAEDPTLQLVPAESTGRSLTPTERAFRDAWLESKQ